MISIHLVQEIGTSREPAKVIIGDGDERRVVIASIDYNQGADGGYYAVVKLAEQKPSKGDSEGGR